VRNSTKPLSRREIAAYLLQILKNPSRLSRLNPVERDQLEFLEGEFREELRQLGWDVGEKIFAPRLHRIRHSWPFSKLLPEGAYRNNRNLFSYEVQDLQVYLDFKYYREASVTRTDSLSRQERLYKSYWGLTFWGQMGKYVGFFFDFRDTKEWGTRKYPVREYTTFERIGYASAHGSYIYHDETMASVIVGSKFWEIELGKNVNRFGPGYRGALALSDWATSYDQIRLYLRFGNIKFISLTGFLKSYPPVPERSYSSYGQQRVIHASKYLAAHRLEFSPFRRLDIGIHETVIYGERGLELAYLNPLMFYWSAEHFLGDQDNVALGADFEWVPISNLKLYGELFLDDLNIAKRGTGWYGNKWGLLAGLYKTDFAGWDNFDLRVEGAILRPYVYTHRYPINVYKHYNSTLGHWMGPNSLQGYGGLEYRPSRYLLLRLSYEYWKHGANPPDGNVGGDIDLPRRPEDSPYVDFFQGEVEQRHSFQVSVVWEIFRNCYLEMEGIHRRSRHVLWSDGSRRPVEEWVVRFAFSLNP